MRHGFLLFCFIMKPIIDEEAFHESKIHGADFMAD